MDKLNISTTRTLTNPHIIYEILMKLDYDSIIQYCSSYTFASNICSEPLFWEEKSERNLKVPRELFRMTDKSANLRYLELLNETRGVIIYSKYYTLHKFIKWSIQNNHIDFYNYGIKSGFHNWNFALYEFSKKPYISENKKIIDKLLELTGDYNAVAMGALEVNNMSLFNHIFTKAKHYEWNWNKLLQSAGKNGNIELFIFIKNINSQNIFNWDKIVRRILEHGHKELFDYVYHNIDWDRNWNKLAASAIYYSDQLFNYIQTIAPINSIDNWNLLANTVLMRGNIKLFNYIQLMAPENYQWNWYTILLGAVMSEDINVVNHVLKLVTPLLPVDTLNIWNNIYIEAVKSGNIELFDVIHTAKINYEWNLLLKQVVKRNNAELLNSVQILERTPDNWTKLMDHIQQSGDKQLYNYIRTMLLRDNWPVILYQSLKSRGAKFFEHILSFYPNQYKLNWEKIILAAFDLDDNNMYNYLIEMINKYEPGVKLSWTNILIHAITTNKIRVFTTALKYIPMNYNINWYQLLISIVLTKTDSQKDIDMLNALITFIPQNYQIDWRNIGLHAKSVAHYNIYNYIRTTIAPELNWDV